MIHGHGFWFIVVWACVVWYSTITLYVAYQGARDIKGMLRRLREGQDSESEEKPK